MVTDIIKITILYLALVSNGLGTGIRHVITNLTGFNHLLHQVTGFADMLGDFFQDLLLVGIAIVFQTSFLQSTYIFFKQFLLTDGSWV